MGEGGLFGFSVVSYPRSCSDLERSEAKQNSMEKQRQTTNSFAQDSNLSRLISTLLSSPAGKALAESMMFFNSNSILEK